MKNFFYSSFIVIGVIFLSLSVSWVHKHGFRRPYIEWNIQDLAEHLAARKLSPRGCFDLVWHQIGQQAGEAQAECIYTFAKLTKDPSACELLMPSSYGLSCVGAATKNRPCLFDDQKNVIWNDGEYNEVPYDQCSKDTGSEMGNMCCKAAAAKFDPTFVDGCSTFKSYDPLLTDYCQYEVSRKELNPSLCEEIIDKNLKTACLLEVQTLKDNPDLRDAYPFINTTR